MAERELLEKDRRRTVKQRAADAVAPSHYVDEPALVQRFQNRPGADASYFFDFRSLDRLPVRNDRERLQRRRGETLRPASKLGTLDRLRVLRARQNLPAPRYFDELYAVAIFFIVRAKLGQSFVYRGIAVFGVRANRAQVGEGHWHRAREERGLKQLR